MILRIFPTAQGSDHVNERSVHPRCGSQRGHTHHSTLSEVSDNSSEGGSFGPAAFSTPAIGSSTALQLHFQSRQFHPSFSIPHGRVFPASKVRGTVHRPQYKPLEASSLSIQQFGFQRRNDAKPETKAGGLSHAPSPARIDGELSNASTITALVLSKLLLIVLMV